MSVNIHLSAQEPPDPDYVRQQIFDSYDDFRTELDRVANIADDAQRDQAVDTLWQQLRDAGQVPYAQDNRVAFLYRGNGTVSWPGDANRWNPNAAGWQGTPVGLSDIQILERTLPPDARVDYKVFRNGSWILDPANPLRIWSGFGPNSELRMPKYEYPHETIRRPGSPQGTMSPNMQLNSAQLGYNVRYRVYTPPNYDASGDGLPTVYFTDGHEYSANYLGSATEVIDNLIADGELRPLIAVFVDPRDPTTGVNRRAEQYVSNRQFARFVADDLTSSIDANYATAEDAAERTIFGTSLGGLNSAYFGVVENDTFRNLGIQSPALWADNSVANAYTNGAFANEVRIYMSTGTINDDGGAFAFEQVLHTGGYDYTFQTANEGHSWGNWRADLGDALVTLVGAPVPEPNTIVLVTLGGLFVIRICDRKP